MISFLQRSTSSSVRAGVTLDDDTIAIALVERTGDLVRLRHCSVTSGSGNDWARRTQKATSDVEMRRVPVTTVVAENAYQLVLVECPQVPDEEVADAVRWRIKDLVAFSTEEAVIDTIDIPALANQTSRPMIYAVAADPKLVARRVDAVSAAGLQLDAIDIPEMCLRNIANCLPEEEQGVALLHLEEEHGTLILSRGGVLYLIRRIDTGRRAVRALCEGEISLGDVVSDIALEVQRSLDYFESHYDQRPITQIVLGPGVPQSFPAMLGEQLGLPVAALDLNAVLDVAQPIPVEQQPAAIMAVGAALRSAAVEAAA
jgi:MSHA biogenesis protein MshI